MTYVDHLSDDTKEDSEMMFEIIENINDHPEVIENKILVLKSDNWSDSVKADTPFIEWKNLLKNIQSQ